MRVELKVRNKLMKHFYILGYAAIYLMGFSKQETLATTWGISSSEWMRLDSDNIKPMLYDKCPKKDPKCTKCKKFTDYKVNQDFSKLFGGQENLSKYYCFYKISKEEERKVKQADKLKDKFDSTKHITFGYEDVCNSYCLPTSGKKCNKLKKGESKESANKSLYFCEQAKKSALPAPPK